MDGSGISLEEALADRSEDIRNAAKAEIKRLLASYKDVVQKAMDEYKQVS
jgi:hypothetical protein